MTPSLWLADLRSKRWIPVDGGEQAVTHHVPNPELLRDLIDHSWLQDNREGVNLLVAHFDMDSLELQLLAAEPNEEDRQQLRDRLAMVVEFTANNPQLIEELVAKTQQRLRDVNRMRKLGLAVQTRVMVKLKEHGLSVMDDEGRGYRGYDLLVTSVDVNEKDPESAFFEVGEYKVEVKATTTGEVCLTPLQAQTAVEIPATFALCVVDLRHFSGDVHQVDWTEEPIADLCCFVSGQDLPIDEPLSLVRNAEVSEIRIRNSVALRYAVQSDRWTKGLNLDKWVEVTFT